jgi:mannose-6-phosphate isomerase-like protein (cupin superfamily)
MGQSSAKENMGLGVDMKSFRKLAAAGIVCLAAVIPAAAQPGTIFYSWSPKPVPLTSWKAPNKPIWRLSEILASHTGEKNWVQPIVRDQDYSADYIQQAPGENTRPQFWADDRVFWYIASGSIRFTIQGQEPFVATKGFLVQVPYRTPYSLETIGSEPSVRFEVTRANRTPLYPATGRDDAGPAPTAKGKVYVLASYRTPPDPYTDQNKPYVDFLKNYVNSTVPPKPGDHAFVKDANNFMNVIRGKGMPTPPDSNKGHFHIDYNEFWVIAEGTVDYKMEGMPFFTANVGDIVYAPQGRWHRASWAGTGMSTRIAINPRPEGMHNFDAEAGAKQ